MLKKTIPLVLATFIFAGCSLKMPSFSMPSFLQFEDKNLASLEEANLCQKIESLDSKLTCYKKLLKTNNSYAQLRMGTYHADRKEYKDAIKYLNLSKENDNLYSNLALAFLYYKGDGVEKNIDKSFELLEESSHVDPNAAYQLARFYLQGINTKVDHQKGVELVEFAAQKGVITAQKMLVNINKQGLFSQPKDQKKVDYWEAKIKENKEDLTFKVYKI
ncbi:SEL1-like repeat protein [bacterium]|nr:SEL1-like repeat protein [bacterium]